MVNGRVPRADEGDDLADQRIVAELAATCVEPLAKRAGAEKQAR